MTRKTPKPTQLPYHCHQCDERRPVIFSVTSLPLSPRSWDIWEPHSAFFSVMSLVSYTFFSPCELLLQIQHNFLSIIFCVQFRTTSITCSLSYHTPPSRSRKARQPAGLYIRSVLNAGAVFSVILGWACSTLLREFSIKERMSNFYNTQLFDV